MQSETQAFENKIYQAHNDSDGVAHDVEKEEVSLKDLCVAEIEVDENLMLAVHRC